MLTAYIQPTGLSTDQMNTTSPMTTAELDTTFAALADPTRRAILARLADGDATVNELAEPFAVSVQAVSKHLKVLERAGLISRGRDGQLRPSRLEAAPLKDAVDWLARYRKFYDGKLDRLEKHLQSIQLKDASR
jgi:DNA-binding transcriptional ArsR family regulator